jgi:hypothetical protein
LPSRYRVVLREPARDLLERLAEEDRPACRRLALLLLRLEKTPRPAGSRELSPLEDPRRGERLWVQGEFQIAYRLDEGAREVDVGLIQRLGSPARARPPSGS